MAESSVAESDVIVAEGLPARRRFVRFGLLVIVVTLIAALGLVAALARPTSLGAVRTAVGDGVEEARQLWLAATFWPAAPYPESDVISGIDLDWSTHYRAADGSGDWGITWADDGHQYTAWGNGGGFGGTNLDGRVMLGFARIEGDVDEHRGFNVWGGVNAENPAEFDGKAYSLLSVDGVLYTWRCGDGEGAASLKFQELYRSTNHSATWRSTGVRFTQDSFGADDPGFFCPIFLQSGRDYADAPDGYVYAYAPEIQQTADLYPQVPGEITLMRVPRAKVNVRSAYEFYAGLGENGQPDWSFDGSDRRPVFEDAENGITHHIAALYNPGIDRYILTAEHGAHAEGNLGIYDAPTPWGPWTTVKFTSGFGRFSTPDNSFMWVFPSKWLSEDGKDFVMIYTGKRRNDSWNTVKGRFLLRDDSD